MSITYTINLSPRKCHICGGKVVYTSNDAIYGKQYGSGYCYVCTDCRAYVGTHKDRPLQALGVLADDRMREMRKKCHDIFDKTWSTPKERKERYAELAHKLGIGVESCHFAYFTMPLLDRAYLILNGGAENGKGTDN